MKYHDDNSYPFLLPKTYDDENELNDTNWKAFLASSPFRVDVQCVRAMGPWSSNVKVTEASIHSAYIEMIQAAQHYIFIEVFIITKKFFAIVHFCDCIFKNQFFVTGSHADIHNQIGDALYQRIVRAHQ